MRYLAAVLVVVSTALWLGGLVSLFVLAVSVFNASGLDRPTAGKATSAMFVAFSKYQLLLAGVALVGTFLAYLSRKTALPVALFALFAIATVGAVANNLFLVPRMEELRLAGEAQTPAFGKLHGYSMILFTSMTAVVLIGALLIPRLCAGLLREQAPQASET